ncbi:MAG: hypothetical protein GXO33_07585 [Epsilonproteobacteria bacterium]|nr:hypothetical protein [Campylobacterota bacterium]
MKRWGIWIALTATAALADYTMVYDMGDAKQTIRYKDANHVKVITQSSDGESGGYMIVGKRKVMLVKKGNKTEYIDMDEMAQQMGAFNQIFGQAAAQMPPEAGVGEETGNGSVKMIKRVGTANVAGIVGERWLIEVNEGEGPQRMEVVVSDDPTLVKAMKRIGEAMNTMSMGDAMDYTLDGHYVLLKADGITLKKFSRRDIPAAEFSLPAAVASKKTKSAVTRDGKAPVLCLGSKGNGPAKLLGPMLKSSGGGWKLVKSSNCMDMMGIVLDNALYQKGNRYIVVSLSNDPNDKGVIARNRANGMKVENLKQGRIQGVRYQEGFVALAKQEALNARLPGAMLEVYAPSGRPDLAAFVQKTINLKAYKAAAKTKKGTNTRPSPDEQMQQQMQKATEMLKGLFGGM